MQVFFVMSEAGMAFVKKLGLIYVKKNGHAFYHDLYTYSVLD